MALSTRTIYIDVGEPETGIWCATCLLPARFRFPLLHLAERGVTHLSTVERCLKCSRSDNQDDDCG